MRMVLEERKSMNEMEGSEWQRRVVMRERDKVKRNLGYKNVS